MSKAASPGGQRRGKMRSLSRKIRPIQTLPASHRPVDGYRLKRRLGRGARPTWFWWWSRF